MSRDLLSQRFWEAAKKFLEHNKSASFLEEMKSASLSQMMMKQGDIPVSKAEMLVKASPEWEEYLKLMTDSRAAANEAKLQMEYLRMRMSERMSEEATARMEAKL